MNYEKASNGATKSHTTTTKNSGSIRSFWNDHIMERFIKANLFVICCVAAGLLLIVYLAAFSCEVSWILEARGELPISAFILCAQYFIVFVATTILIHGLVTGIPWGLFAWAIVIGVFSIPELIFVMMMTTQHWGLQSVHGLTELISYLIRLVINCVALICVIPTALRWRRETQVLAQLQDLATRLQIQTPSLPCAMISKADSRRSSKRLQNHAAAQAAFENAGYQVSELNAKLQMNAMNGMNGPPQGLSMYNNNNNPIFGSQNEFNAAMFAPPPYMHQFNNALLGRNGHRAQSLMDLRCTLPGLYNPRYALDAEDKNGNGKYFNITIDDLKNNLQESNGKNQTPSLMGSINGPNDPIYCSIEPNIKQPTPPQQRQRGGNSGPAAVVPSSPQEKAKLARNCISLENLDGITKVQNDLAAYGNNLLQNYTQQQYYLAMLNGFLPPVQHSNLNVYRRASHIANGGADAFSGTVHAQPLQRRGSQHLQYYGGFGYHNYANPYIMANSKLSLGQESDDYRKYRDVAL